MLCCLFNRVWLCATLWTVAHQAPLSMEFSRQEYWSGLPCPPPRDLPDSGIEPVSLALTSGFFTNSAPWEAQTTLYEIAFWKATERGRYCVWCSLNHLSTPIPFLLLPLSFLFSFLPLPSSLSLSLTHKHTCFSPCDEQVKFVSLLLPNEINNLSGRLT